MNPRATAALATALLLAAAVFLLLRPAPLPPPPPPSASAVAVPEATPAVPRSPATSPATPATTPPSPSPSSSPQPRPDLPAPLPDTVELEPAFAAFHRWLETTSHPADVDAERAGLRLAQRRREELLDLIPSNPRRALELALPDACHAVLSPSIRALLEERVRGVGDLEVLCAYPEPGREREVRRLQRFVVLGDRRWEAHVFGQRRHEPTLRGVPLAGIALDGLMAVEGESGLPEADDAGGLTLAASPATEGLKRLIFIRVDFSDLTGEPFSAERAASLTRDLHRFYAENSYGRAGFLEIGSGSAVTPVFRLSRTASSYGSANAASDLRRDARAAARAAGYNLDEYDYDITCLRSVPGFGWAGLGFVGAPGAWIRGTSSTGVTAHELGHNFGLNHANFWDTGGASVTGAGESVEYGDKFDTMGAASAGANHFNARFKRLLDWLQPGEFTVATTNGVYRLYAHDQTNAAAGPRGLQVFANARTNYWLEFRQRFPANAWMMHGAGLRWAGRGNEASLLLDTTPGSTREKDDSPLPIGRTFSDPVAGIHLTPIARGGTAPAWLDILVQRGRFPANRPPDLTLDAPVTSGTVATTFTFEAHTDDPDGDTPAFFWDFGDATPGDNRPSITHRWSAAGEYRVQCTVSDGRGGVTRASTVIRVGTPTTLRLGGEVTRDGEPQPGIRVSVGQGRQTFTDSDGTYTLTGLTRGTYTLTATTPDGERLEPRGFTNPVNLTASREDFDFARAATSVSPPVTLVAAGSAWHYWDLDTLPGDAWAQPGFDDSTWNVGAAILGYGGDRETTVIRFGPSSNQKRLTTWFRRRFVVEDPRQLSAVTLGLLRDDGAVVYLNGVELLRDNMPAGTITPTTRASATVGGTEELTYFEHAVPESLFVAGTNLLAVEVHQVSPTSSDTAFDLRLSAQVRSAATHGIRLARPLADETFTAPAAVVLTAIVDTPGDLAVERVEFTADDQVLGTATRAPFSITWNPAPPGDHVLAAAVRFADGTHQTSPVVRITVQDPATLPVLIPAGSVWRYLDTGIPPGADWTRAGFDDAAWREGPARLGYGEDGEFTVVSYGPDPNNRPITTWFRHAFEVVDTPAFTGLVGRLQRDDGAAVYLNGTEVFRLGLRSGVLSPTLTAQSDIRNEAEQVFTEFPLDPRLLAEGRNVVAVELHQVSRSSTDLGFDLELQGRRSPPVAAPTLAWRLEATGLRLRWPAVPAGWYLETTPSLTPPVVWSPAPGAAVPSGDHLEQDVPATPAFYRLAR